MFLSGYKIMWMMVLFDLPVTDRQERKDATLFRKFLLDQGFQMSQYSVYYRVLSGKEAMESYVEKITQNLPTQGKVDIITITDKQYENIVSFSGREKKNKTKCHQQYLIF